MSTKAEVIASIDAALLSANNLDDRQALIDQLTSDLATRTSERDALQTKINAAKSAAQADKAADAANVAGQGVLDALA